jgi:hypothetical protein
VFIHDAREVVSEGDTLWAMLTEINKKDFFGRLTLNQDKKRSDPEFFPPMIEDTYFLLHESDDEDEVEEKPEV